MEDGWEGSGKGREGDGLHSLGPVAGLKDGYEGYGKERLVSAC